MKREVVLGIMITVGMRLTTAAGPQALGQRAGQAPKVAAGAGGDLAAQSSAPQQPRFEVVSVKRNTGGGVTSMMSIQPGGRFSARNLAVRQVILPAFGIQPFQLTGGPDWLQSERYDIDAKAPDGAVATGDAINVMLQAMLADRFKLKVRRETRESPLYELVFARSDRQLGEKLRQTSADCVASRGRPTQPESRSACISSATMFRR